MVKQMGMNIKVQGIDQLMAQFREFPKLTERATVNALNTLARAARTEARKGIQDEYNIKSRDISNAVDMIPARSFGGGKQRMFAIITARGGRLPLLKFGASPSVPKSQKGIAVAGRRPVTVMVKKSGGRHPVYADKQTSHVPFLARMKSGHIAIMVRTDKVKTRRMGTKTQRYETIREIMAEGIPRMFEKKGGEAMRRLVQETGLDVFRQKLRDQLAKYLKK
jgi:hypothetical protein